MSFPTPDAVAAVAPVVETLDGLGVRYHIGGSLAVAAYGVPRSSADVDLVAELRVEDADRFVEQLERDYYVDRERVRAAARERGTFNLIHLASMMKVDVFVAEALPFAEQEQNRARPERIGSGENARVFLVKSPEDLVLRKLLWYRAGGEISERQWSDVVGLLKLRATRLDGDYLAHWAADLDISDLLHRALTSSR